MSAEEQGTDSEHIHTWGQSWTHQQNCSLISLTCAHGPSDSADRLPAAAVRESASKTGFNNFHAAGFKTASSQTGPLRGSPDIRRGVFQNKSTSLFHEFMEQCGFCKAAWGQHTHTTLSTLCYRPAIKWGADHSCLMCHIWKALWSTKTLVIAAVGIKSVSHHFFSVILTTFPDSFVIVGALKLRRWSGSKVAGSNPASSWLRVKVSLCGILKPKLLLMCMWTW